MQTVLPVQGFRLRLLLRRGDLPLWVGELLLGLDRLENCALQVQWVTPAAPTPEISGVARWWLARMPELMPCAPDHPVQERMAHWEATAEGEADISFVLDASLCLDAAASVGSKVQWTLSDGRGQRLCEQFPLLTDICTGNGVHLLLNERESISGAWQPRRRLHLGASSRYRTAPRLMASGILRLVSQALTDRQLGCRIAPLQAGSALEKIGLVDAPSLPQGAWWTCMKGYGRALWSRARALTLSEYWRIGVVDAPIHTLLQGAALPEVKWLTSATRTGYWADPFGLPGDSSQLACEYFDEQTGVGSLEVLRLDGSGQMVGRVPLSVGGGGHASFPNVFELNGQRLGIAETLAMRECVLHEVDATGIWHPLYPLLEDVAAADPALFTWEGRLWLAYTDVDMGTLDNLCLQYAESLEGPWTPHANNPVKVDITGARMAGGLFTENGALYRPAQNCLQTYGGGIVLHQITELTPHSFREVVVRNITPDASGPCPHGLHTLNAWGDRTLVDGKRHGVNSVALWRNLRNRLMRFRQRNSSRLTTPPDAGHVVVYVPHLRTGGGEISMVRLAAGLAATGLKVDLVVHSESTRELTVPVGVNMISLNCGGTTAAVWKLSRLLRERRPRWILSAFPHTNIAAVVALTLSGQDSRCVISEHAPLSLQIDQQGSWRYRLLPPLVRWAYSNAHAVVAVSGGVRDDLKRLLGPRSSPQVISNPVLAPDFETEMALSPDEPWLADPAFEVVLSVCRLSVEKDLVTLIRAFAEVHRVRPYARLVLAGEGADRLRLQALVNDLGLADVVRLPGRTSMPLAWMRHAAVFVLASQYEGFGNVLVEAMACGTPVVSTDCPVGPREILDGGRLGTLVPVGDAPAMAHAIVAVLALPEPRPGAREAALRYTQKHACERYLELFESLYTSGAKC